MVELSYLSSDQNLVRTLAQWHQETWGHLTGRSVEERIAEFDRQRNSNLIPLTVVAWVEGVPVGSASLLEEDMETHADLSPWLASVFVLPDYRRRGIGERLCRRIVGEARRLALEELYLFTEDKEAFYRGMGWETISQEVYRGESVTLMRIRPED